MKKSTLFVTGVIISITVAVFAQAWYGRLPYPVEQGFVAGLRTYAQTQLDRLVKPKISIIESTVTPGTEDGIIFIDDSGQEDLVYLPNPTNTIGRRFVIVTMNNTTARMTNNTFDGSVTFTEQTNGTTAAFYLMNSNRIGHFYSTGTNYFVYLN